MNRIVAASPHEGSFGVYIHLPFCQSRCSYCHFVTRPWQAETADRYCRCVVREISGFFRSSPQTGGADSIYFGGGTPSMVPAGHIQAILDACRRSFRLDEGAEISLEANPGTLSRAKVEAYRCAGINRVSMGAQSFDDTELRSLGRTHTADEIAESLSLLRSCGFGNVNLDVMLGLPRQTEAVFLRTLERLAVLAPEHVSLYMLDLDVKSPLQHAIASGLYAVPDDDLVADLYLRAIERLEEHGYAQYEISNFALPGFESRHNLKYWRREPVLGFGVGSHSHDGSARRANVSDLASYLRAVETGGSPVDWQTELGLSQQIGESLFLGLRLRQGVDWGELVRIYGTESMQAHEQSFRNMVENGLVERSGSTLRLTRRGLLLSNEVFQEFV